MTGYEALRSHVAWIDLSTRGKIRVTGEDRARLLHAMSTNDVNHLAPGQGLYAFFLNDKGRILADAYIYNLGETLLLDTEPETGEKLRDHLDRYIIADDAELTDETNTWATIELAGPNSFELASEVGIPLPESNYGILGWNRGFVIRLPSIRVFVHVEARQELVSRLESASIPHASAEEARIVRIENGIPRYGEEISERYLVQETGVAHAVHYNKGCYLGQEIVERVRSRGQVHRVLRPVRIEAKDPPAPGTKLSAGGKDVAEIASAVYSPALGAVAALAYVRTEAAQTNPEMVVSGSAPPIRAHIVNAATA
jgi:aminomethyltransferase